MPLMRLLLDLKPIRDLLQNKLRMALINSLLKLKTAQTIDKISKTWSGLSESMGS